MMKKHFFHHLIILVVGVAFFSACKKEIHTTGIKLNKNEIILIPGDKDTLIAYVQPDNSTNQIVKWRSSNEAVATVSDNGIVSAINNGNAIITAITENENFADSCSIIVDFRIQYVGDWDFVVKRIEYNGPYQYESNYNYSGKIILGNGEREIIIGYSSMPSIMIFTNTEAGYIISPNSPTDIQGEFIGKNIVFINGFGSSLNGFYKWELRVDGTKINTR
jgi:hypothetical protein